MEKGKPHIALFIPCYVDQFYPNVAIATLELLEKLGCRVTYPIDQTCCGQPMANAGYERDTKGTTEKFIDDFKSYDYVVAPSGSCVLHIKEHQPEIAHLKKEQKELKSKVFELSEFLVDILNFEGCAGEFPHRIGFHASCHGLRGLNLGNPSELNTQPFNKVFELLKNIKDLEWVELSRKDECCGFGGTFAVAEEALSVQMGKDRLADHKEKGVEIIVGGDMSCLMHLQGIADRQKSGIRTMHFAEILNQLVK